MDNNSTMNNLLVKEEGKLLHYYKITLSYSVNALSRSG